MMNSARYPASHMKPKIGGVHDRIHFGLVCDVPANAFDDHTVNHSRVHELATLHQKNSHSMCQIPWFAITESPPSKNAY